MTVAYLSTTADAILAAAQAALVQTTTGKAPPDECFVSHGPPPADRACDGGGMLTVHLDLLGHLPFDEDQMQQACILVPRPVFVVTLLRCVPSLVEDGNNPLPATTDLDTSAGELLVDLWALLTEFYDRLAAGTLIPGVVGCDIAIGEAAAIPPSGGVAGWAIPLTMTANDTGPTGS